MKLFTLLSWRFFVFCAKNVTQLGAILRSVLERHISKNQLNILGSGLDTGRTLRYDIRLMH